MKPQPKLFAIAKSSTGTIGLITCPERVEHTYPDGNTALVWKGVVLQDNSFIGRDNLPVEAKVGNFWSTTQEEPEIIAYADADTIINMAKVVD